MSPARPLDEEIAAVCGSSHAFGDPWRAGETGLSRLGGQSRLVRLGVPAPSADEVDRRENLRGESPKPRSGPPVFVAPQRLRPPRRCREHSTGWPGRSTTTA